jgi:HD-like signal output (HDOD) protein
MPKFVILLARYARESQFNLEQTMNLEILVKAASRLFTLPEICIKIQEVIYDPSSSASDIAKLISVDPSLSARLLKIANSPYYNFPSKIDDLSRAVNLIGTADLFNLAVATSTPDAFEKLKKNKTIDIHAYWRHSVMSGLIARALGQKLKIPNNEQYFLAGLFHNLGQLVILEQHPDSFTQIEKLKETGVAPWQAEHQVLNHTYAEISYELLVCWKMPENIIELVKHQHEPFKSSDTRSCSLLHIGSRVASELEFGHQYNFKEAIISSAWASTGIDEEQLDAAIALAEINCHAILSAMTGNQMVA